MNKRKVALGPGAASLILIVVVLSLCMMAMLTQIGARNDYNLCRRSADMVQRVYELNEQSEQKLAELDAVLSVSEEGGGASAGGYDDGRRQSHLDGAPGQPEPGMYRPAAALGGETADEMDFA